MFTTIAPLSNDRAGNHELTSSKLLGTLFPCSAEEKTSENPSQAHVYECAYPFRPSDGDLNDFYIYLNCRLAPLTFA